MSERVGVRFRSLLVAGSLEVCIVVVVVAVAVVVYMHLQIC